MAWTPTQEDILRRVDEIDAMVRGVILHLAAVAEGKTVDTDDPTWKELVRKAARQDGATLQQTGTKPGRGFFVAAGMGQIDNLRSEIRQAFPNK